MKKLNTTTYHQGWDGMVERFNRTLKTMIRKHVDQFGSSGIDTCLGCSGLRNTPNESTGEKPLFLLFGLDCHSHTEVCI